jgi:hypothetical protein
MIFLNRFGNLNFFFLLLFFIFLMPFSFASSPVVNITISEYVSEIVAYDQTKDVGGVTIEALGELGENRTNESRTGVKLNDLVSYGFINISNVHGAENLVSINLTLENTQNISLIELFSNPDYLVYNITPNPNFGSVSNVSIFLNELRAGDDVVFFYNISSVLGEPLNITETYDSWRVMTGETIYANLSAHNSFPVNMTLYDLEIIKTPTGYDSLEGYVKYFNFSNLVGSDSMNADIVVDGSNKSILYWNVSNRTLISGDEKNIGFNILVPKNLSFDWSSTPDWATWLNMGNLSASFKFNGSMSGLFIKSISAKPSTFGMGVLKDRVNESDWRASVNLSNYASDVDYNVSYISIWATKYQHYSEPDDVSFLINNSNIIVSSGANLFSSYVKSEWFPNISLNSSSYLNNYSLSFNYSLIPVVWAKSILDLKDDGTQISMLNYTSSIQNGYLMIEEIYVLFGGYLVKVTKTIKPLKYGGINPAVNRYYVNITLENIGDEKTPELVTLYDLVPSGFWPCIYLGDWLSPTRNMTQNNIMRVTDSVGNWQFLHNSDLLLGYYDTGAISGGPYNNYWGYRLDLTGLNPNSDGDGFYNSTTPLSEFGVSYKIEGNETLSSIESAFIVGVDPIRLEGANPSRFVLSEIDIRSFTSELVVILTSLSVFSISIIYLFKLDMKNIVVLSKKRKNNKNKKY